MQCLEDQMIHGCPPRRDRRDAQSYGKHKRGIRADRAQGTSRRPPEEEMPGVWPRWTSPARIEHETVLVPRAVADGVWEEAGLWLGEELPREWLVRLTERAEAVYASNARVRRQLRGPGNGGRDWLWTFMRHWLAALIWRQRPDLHARLPASFNVGHPLPSARPGRQHRIAATDTQIDRLVYDLYGLTEDEIKIVEGGTA